jgi:hypothetical protein
MQISSSEIQIIKGGDFQRDRFYHYHRWPRRRDIYKQYGFRVAALTPIESIQAATVIARDSVIDAL